MSRDKKHRTPPLVSRERRDTFGALSAEELDYLNNRHEREENQQKLQKIQEALQWLCEAFPDCFNIRKPVPLKRGNGFSDIKAVWKSLTKPLQRFLNFLELLLIFFSLVPVIQVVKLFR